MTHQRTSKCSNWADMSRRNHFKNAISLKTGDFSKLFLLSAVPLLDVVIGESMSKRRIRPKLTMKLEGVSGEAGLEK